LTKFLLDMLFYYQMNSSSLLRNHLYTEILDQVNSTFHPHKLSKYPTIELLLYYTSLHYKEYTVRQPTVQLKLNTFLRYTIP
jgi:hypothetical protein